MPELSVNGAAWQVATGVFLSSANELHPGFTLSQLRAAHRASDWTLPRHAYRPGQSRTDLI